MQNLQMILLDVKSSSGIYEGLFENIKHRIVLRWARINMKVTISFRTINISIATVDASLYGCVIVKEGMCQIRLSKTLNIDEYAW